MLRLLYEQINLPVFQNRMYDNERDAIDCPKGDIALVEDLNTGLVYNAKFQPKFMTYDGHYQNEQAVSAYFQRHLAQVAGLVEQHIGKASLVEVGCGKGTFLEMLLKNGFDVTGFDPTYEGTNPRVRKQYFDRGVVDGAQGLMLRHVLEHVENPYDFLCQLRDANGGSGKIYIEVPCFDWICQHKAWFDIFYEHANYFRLSDFKRMFGNVIECGKLFGDQYIYVIAELSSLRPPLFEASDQVVFPSDFTRSIEEPRPHGGSTQTAVWGGASKGVIFTLLKSRFGQAVDSVIDINPAKQGRYLAATGLRVASPAEAMAKLSPGATIFVMNSNYLEEIKQMSHNRFNYIGIDHE